jgi:hypothetical protein
MQCILCKIYFLESFSYELQFDMHSYLHKNFILAKSGCYRVRELEVQKILKSVTSTRMNQDLPDAPVIMSIDTVICPK